MSTYGKRLGGGGSVTVSAGTGLSGDGTSGSPLAGVPSSASVPGTMSVADFLKLLTGFKEPVVVVATSNLTLSGEQTIDGVLTSASRVLLVGQTAGAENGIYVTAAGAWARASDFDATAEIVAGTMIYVQQGTVGARSLYRLTTTGAITIGATVLTFSSSGADGSTTRVAYGFLSAQNTGFLYETGTPSMRFIFGGAIHSYFQSARLELNAGTVFGMGASGDFALTRNSSTGMVTAVSNYGFGFATGALATNAAGGYLQLQSMAGPPTVVPTPIQAGQIPIIYDSAGKRWFAYDGDWIGVTRKGKGADVASAATLVISPADRSSRAYFQVTGTTAVDFIQYTATDVHGDVMDGDEIVLYCVGAVTFNNNTGAPGAGTHALQNIAAANVAVAAGGKICYRRDAALARWVHMWTAAA